jgi:predicted RNA-binding Zn-ribbon protein involved in translation (DUF1610 family)
MSAIQHLIDNILMEIAHEDMPDLRELCNSANTELESLRADVHYCPECGNVVTPCDRANNVFYCGICNKNLLQPEVDSYKGETKGGK